MIYLAYLMVTGPMLKKRLQGKWPPRISPRAATSRMGRWGLPVNIVAVVWGVGMAVNLAWPRAGRYGGALVQHLGRVHLHRRDPGASACSGIASRAAHHIGTPGVPRRARSRRPRSRSSGVSERRRHVRLCHRRRRHGGLCVGGPALARIQRVTVCLLEAGPSDVGDDNILVLAEWMHLLDSGYDWDYPVEPQEQGNSFMRHARAKVLGGCSSHNSCIAFWPPAEGLDEWVAMGATGWGAAETLPLCRGWRPTTRRATTTAVRTGAAARRPARRPVRAARAGGRRDGSGCPPSRSTGARPCATARAGSRSTPTRTAPGMSSARTRTCIRSWSPAPQPGGTHRAAGWPRSCSTTPMRHRRRATSGPDLTGHDTVSARREVIVTPRAPSTPRSC